MEVNKLYYGDNLEVLQKYIPDNSIDLCYIDPPFNSKRNYNQIYNNIGTEDVAQAQAFVDTWFWDDASVLGFDEIVSNKRGNYTYQTIQLVLGLDKVLGKGSLFAYVISMTQRVAEIHRVLKPTGSFYLHCDPTASHYLKLILDSIFCPKGGEFRNEIVWVYKERELSKKHYNKKHDIIFFYTKSKDYTFNFDRIMEKYSDYTLKNKFKYKDEKGFYRLRYKDGRSDPKQESEDTYRQYADKGVLPRDWFLIPIINQASKERLGYPTQKPEALLEKLILASSNKGDVILDAYCGCGTTISVAQKLNRKWIGIDITYQSISLIMKRLEDSFGKNATHEVLETSKQVINLDFVVSGVPQDFESAVALANKKDDRLRKEFEKWAILTFSNNRAIINDKKGGDEGIDGRVFIKDFDNNSKLIHKEVLFSVKSSKNLSPSVVRDLFGTVEREKAAIGYLLTLYPMDNLSKESSKYGTYTNQILERSYPKIVIISIQDILDGKRLELPYMAEVLKSAERKQTNQPSMFD